MHEDLREFVVITVAGVAERLTSSRISDAFLTAQVSAGQWPKMPQELRAFVFDGIQQFVRPLLRELAPDESEPDDAQLTMDMPEADLLQHRYSVIGEGGESYYVLHSAMTEEEMRQKVVRFRRLSIRFERHAKALEASWYRERDDRNDA